ncbi:GNAT family N-acetyltransferase [Myxococcota bacterium]|nr:GNAT family N-acetyltransferase [Myxococcota bacterium]
MRADVQVGRVRVRRVTAEELPTCLEIRRLVFILEQQVPEPEDVDGLDPQATHFLVEWRADESGYVDEGWVAVGTARLRRVQAEDGQPVGKIERVAVLREHRGRGFGVAVMAEVEAEARRWGMLRVKLAAQEAAVPFYLSLGYRAYGERFMDAGIPHFWMDKELGEAC